MLINNPSLSAEEFAQLRDAIAHITILIAGADGVIETKELEWAKKITDIRSYNLPETLSNFYKEVGKDYQERLEQLIADLPDQVDQRSEVISDKLAALNPIMAKLSKRVGAELYQSYLSFAKHVAKSSGGFLGFFSVTYEESQFMDLPMIDAIYYDGEEE